MKYFLVKLNTIALNINVPIKHKKAPQPLVEDKPFLLICAITIIGVDQIRSVKIEVVFMNILNTACFLKTLIALYTAFPLVQFPFL